LAKVGEHELEIRKEEVDRVMNCPFAYGLDHRWGDQIVDRKACKGCKLYDWKAGCVYIVANLPTVRTAVFDEESQMSWFFSRFNCYYCGHPVLMVTFYQNRSAGEHGRCMGCGAFHFYIKYDMDFSSKEEWWYAVSRPVPEGLPGIKKGDAKREYQIRIPNRSKEEAGLKEE
jgi:hypothetical protein